MKVEYYNYSMCKLCGGKCCQGYAGSYRPEDFKHEITPEFIVSLLRGEKISIDWWEGDAMGFDLSQTYFLRPRHKNEPAIHGSWGGECINWSKQKGCSIGEDDRPYGCRKLIPKLSDGKPECFTKDEDKADKQGVAIYWYKYQGIIDSAIRLYFALTGQELILK